jgi:NADPH2:quinone reductase
MTAAVVSSFDAPPRYGPFADPVAGDGEMLVDVAAAGLHQIVKSLASGAHYGSTGELPFVAGIDGVGRLPDGKRVYFGIARAPFGSFAERSPAGALIRIPLPDEVDDVTAAAIANPAMSSWVALTARARFTRGERVLILGATGVAGRLAVQVAKRLGASRVVAAGRNPQALSAVKQLGADVTLSLAQEQDALVEAFRRELAEGGIDVVLDYVWGEPAECFFRAISQRGLQRSSPRVRFVQIGAMAGTTISLAAETLRSSAVELLGSGFGSASMNQIRDGLAEFFAAAAREPFTIDVKKAPLRDVEALWNSAGDGARLVFCP